MRTHKDLGSLSTTVTLGEIELLRAVDAYPGAVARLFAERYVEENYSKLIKDGAVLAEAKTEAQHIIAQHIAKRVTEAFDKGLEIKQ